VYLEGLVLASLVLSVAILVVTRRGLPLLRFDEARAALPPSNGDADRRISVIVPARNEGVRIRATLASILASELDGELVEIWVVDDESSDDTASIVEEMAREQRDRRLRLIRGDTRPRGRTWAGKNWACVQGASRANGDWLFFLDADLEVQPGALNQALDLASRHGIDLLYVIPRIVAPSLASRLTDQIFWGCGLLMLSARALDLVRTNKLPSCTPGAFLVIRHSAYDRLGGHEGVAEDAVEDVALAQKARAMGLRVETCVRPEMGTTPTPDWARVMHAGGGQRILISVGGTLLIFLVHTLPWVALGAAGASLAFESLGLTTGRLIAAASLALLSQRAASSVTQRAFGLPGHAWWLGGIGGVIACALWLRGLFAMEMGLGLMWKGRSVPAKRAPITQGADAPSAAASGPHGEIGRA
jgi:cellulose synthase/poly-beta-1,6-N-acetylglucosamine synthase-like glycosyltransferase